MKKLVYYYLCIYNILDYLLIFFMGGESNVGESFLHPGILIRGCVTALLLFHFLTHKKVGQYFRFFSSLSVFVFLILYPLYSFYRFSYSGLFFELSNSLKFIFFLLLIHFVVKNSSYFLQKLDNILIVNALVVIFNLYLSYFAGFGRTTMYSDSDFSKGFLGGNAQSVYTFIFFAYFLYSFRKSLVHKIIFFLNLFNFYVLGTKGVYFTLPIFLFFIIHNSRRSMLMWVYYMCVAIFVSTVVLLTPLKSVITDLYKGRIGYHFEQENARLESSGKQYEDNAALSTVEDVTAGGRLYASVNQLNYMTSGSSLQWWIGYGAAGQRRIFETAAKMDVVDVFFRYGVLGFFLIYGLILYVLKEIAFRFSFGCFSTIVICTFAYSSLGGFVMGTAGIASIYALFLGLEYSRIISRQKEIACMS